MATSTERLQQRLFSISAVAIAAILAVFALYVFRFHGVLSENPEIWGQFGDYFGGTLNPLLSFFAFLALLFTIVIQHEALELSREELKLTREELAKTADAAQKQALYLEREAKRTDLYRLIETLASRINKNYNENRLEKDRSLHRVFSGEHDVNKNGLLRELYDNFQQDNSLAKRTIKWIESDLERLAALITDYERISGDPSEEGYRTPLAEFFRAEFGAIVKILRTLNMISEKVHVFYCLRKQPNLP